MGAAQGSCFPSPLLRKAHASGSVVAHDGRTRSSVQRASTGSVRNMQRRLPASSILNGIGRAAARPVPADPSVPSPP